MRSAIRPVLVAIALAACGSDSDAPQPEEQALDLAPAYVLATINGEPLPWTEPPPDEETVLAAGTITVTADTFKVRWTGYLEMCPTCVLDRADSLGGPYRRTGPRSFEVSYVAGAPERIMQINLDATGELFLREKVRFLGGIYEQKFSPAP